MRFNSSTRRHRAGGFTLIEILVVVVIVGILGAIIVPNLLGRPDQARVTAAESDIRSLANALDIYRLDNFTYPPRIPGDRPTSTKETVMCSCSFPSARTVPKGATG
jgi:general secretion pathway protein G